MPFLISHSRYTHTRDCRLVGHPGTDFNDVSVSQPAGSARKDVVGGRSSFQYAHDDDDDDDDDDDGGVVVVLAAEGLLECVGPGMSCGVSGFNIWMRVMCTGWLGGRPEVCEGH